MSVKISYGQDISGIYLEKNCPSNTLFVTNLPLSEPGLTLLSSLPSNTLFVTNLPLSEPGLTLLSSLKGLRPTAWSAV
jgi:hypothetical protein